MSSSNAVVATCRALHRIARIALAAAAAAVLLSPAAEAQAQHRRWEFVVPSGRVLPTGTQRDAIQQGGLTAAQLFYVVHPAFAVTTTLGWARSRDVASAGDPKLDVFTYDVGAEVRSDRWHASERVDFNAFVGAGAGGRSYNYRSLDVDATHNIAAYGSAGGEVGYGRVRLRVEARDYVTGFKPLAGTGASDTRNDVAVMVGLRLTSR